MEILKFIKSFNTAGTALLVFLIVYFYFINPA